MTLTILSAAVAAEAIVMAGLLTLIIRLHSRVTRTRQVSGDAIAQMAELVREAQALSMTLADQLDEQLCMQEMLAVSAGAPSPAGAKAVAARKPAAALAEAEEAMPATRKRASRARAAATTTPEPAPARSRVRAMAAQAHVQTADVDDLATDITAARQLGMDPLGIAIQRGLGKQRALLA